MENEEQNYQKQIILEYEKMFKQIFDSKRLTIEEVAVLCRYGVFTGLLYLKNILETIDEKGEKAAGKNFSGDKIDLLINSMNTEFYFRTAHFYAQGQGLLIPEQLGLAHIKLVQAIYDLESEMLYGNVELSTAINQRELAYLFSALSHQAIFYSSANLLAQSLETITNYSEESIRRVILDFKNTNGGWTAEEKEKLIKKISDAINLF